MHNEVVFRLEGIKKSFGNNIVLKEISLQIVRGETVVVIGSSGSGKSTLLRCAALLDPMDEGRIILDEEVISAAGPGLPQRMSEKSLVRKRANFGVVFQQFNLFPHMTAIQNTVEGPLTVKKIPYSAARELGMKMLDLVGLSDRADAMPSELSGGQQQRVAIARALAMEPKVLFLDEPTSALDPEIVSEVLDVLADLAKQGTTMVIVSHEMGFAYEVADRVIFILDGLIGEEGEARSVLREPKTSALKSFLRSFHYSSMRFSEEASRPKK